MNQKDVIQKTGELMLRGWKLLAISCPICNTALLSSKTGEMMCPGCNLPVKDERSTASEIRMCVDAIDDNVDNGTDDSDNMDSLSVSSFDNGRIVSYETTNNHLNDISGKLGEKLLKGWTMRAESCLNTLCRGTPLMQENSSAPLLCVCCNGQYELQNGNVVPFLPAPPVSKSSVIERVVSKATTIHTTSDILAIEKSDKPVPVKNTLVEVSHDEHTPSFQDNRGWRTARRVLEQVKFISISCILNFELTFLLFFFFFFFFFCFPPPPSSIG